MTKFAVSYRWNYGSARSTETEHDIEAPDPEAALLRWLWAQAWEMLDKPLDPKDEDEANMGDCTVNGVYLPGPDGMPGPDRQYDLDTPAAMYALLKEFARRNVERPETGNFEMYDYTYTVEKVEEETTLPCQHCDGFGRIQPALQTAILDVIACGNEVTDNWEHGDLAESVRELDSALEALNALQLARIGPRSWLSKPEGETDANQGEVTG